MSENRTNLKSLALISQLAITMISPIFLCLYLGIKIDKALDFKCLFTLIMLFMGILAGYRNVYKLLAPMLKSSKDKENNDEE